MKWKKFIRRNRYRIRRYKFKNFFVRSFLKKRFRFVRMRKYFKRCLLRKIRLQQLYNNSYKFKALKKSLVHYKTSSYNDLLTNVLAKQLFFLDILLWNMYFFSTTYEAEYYINLGDVLVNDKKVKSNYFLKVGDIIVIKNKKINFSVNFKKYKIFSKFHSYIEFDSYCLTLVILKDFTEFNLDDYASIFSRTFKVISLKNSVL
jgi:ribosomal protein S4